MKVILRKTNDSLAKAFAEPLDLDQEIVYRRLAVVEALLHFMKCEGISRSELAARMGVPPSRITKMLSGDSNLTIDTLVRAGHAVGADLAQTFVPKGQKGHWVPSSKATSRGCGGITVDFTPRKRGKAPTPALGTSQPATRDADAAA